MFSLTKEEELTLDNIGEGAAMEIFQDELKRVMKNIFDLNTSPKKTRTITISISFTPDEDRVMSNIYVSGKSSLVPTNGVSSRVMAGKEGHKIEVREFKINQRELFDKDGNVVPIRPQEEVADNG